MRRHLWWVSGLALVVIGVALTLVDRPTSDFGWFAYSPDDTRIDDYLSHCSVPCRGLSFGSGGHVWLLGPWQVVGAVVVVIGLAVLAGGLGYTIGLRRPQTPPQGSVTY